MTKLLACLLGFSVAAGCGQDNRSHEPEPMAVEDTVFGDQVEQIRRAEERARHMEHRLQDLNKHLETAEGESRTGPDQ